MSVPLISSKPVVKPSPRLASAASEVVKVVVGIRVRDVGVCERYVQVVDAADDAVGVAVEQQMSTCIASVLSYNSGDVTFLIGEFRNTSYCRVMASPLVPDLAGRVPTTYSYESHE